jgi:signal recognition particle subunit SRP54
MLVSVDVYRPAAREQLAVVAKSTGVNLYEGSLTPPSSLLSSAASLLSSRSEALSSRSEAFLSSRSEAEGSASAFVPGTETVLRLAKEAKREAANFGCDILIVDTAGRLGIDTVLMDEMAELKKLLNPSEILFVADAMTGQDAVNSAKAFNDRLTITGAILTKMDGDARGGAALSIRQITGAPIKFLGTGEKPDAFEPFHPDRIVSRIMGMGDIATLLERAEDKLDRGKAEAFAKKALTGQGFSLEDFREQLRQIKKMGSMKSILKMLPSVGPFAGMAQAAENVDESQFTRIESIINSMTNKERQNADLINGSRRKRIANGSGTSVQEVNNLLRQYSQMSKMFKTMGGGMGGGIKAQQRMMQQMQPKQKFGR